MRRLIRGPEFRFIVGGKPESFRSKAAARYKAIVRVAATGTFSHTLTGKVDVLIDYFHLNRRKMDMDNVSKCIMDALTGIAYGDDVQVASQISTAHDLSRPLRIVGSIDLIKPLAEYEEYVFVRLRLHR